MVVVKPGDRVWLVRDAETSLGMFARKSPATVMRDDRDGLTVVCLMHHHREERCHLFLVPTCDLSTLDPSKNRWPAT